MYDSDMSITRFGGISAAVALVATLLSGCGSSDVAVPDLSGMTVTEATTALAEASLTSSIDSTVQTVSDASQWTVQSQEPTAGATVAPYETVTIHVAPRATPTSSPTPSASETETVDAPTAADVETAYKAAWGVSDLSELAGQDGVTLPVYAITQWEDVSTGTVRVYIQETLTSDEKREIGENVLKMVGRELPGLSTVVVRGTDGVDVNIFRSSVSGL